MGYTIAKIVSLLASFTCQICGKSKYNKMYEYQAYSYVPRYKPEHFKKICGNCIYKEVYGSDLYRIKKKEGALDEMLAL
tara:strand:+ start:3529 stop:3765 length:237 start_codon:yes stop_codon:yes gene_type:complete